MDVQNSTPSGRSRMRTSKSRGMIPTTSWTTSLSVTDVPITDDAPPNCRSQNPWLRTTAGGPDTSDGPSVRPSRGGTANVAKKSGETSSPSADRASVGVVTVTPLKKAAETEVNDWLLSFHAR